MAQINQDILSGFVFLEKISLIYGTKDSKIVNPDKYPAISAIINLVYQKIAFLAILWACAVEGLVNDVRTVFEG